MDVYELTVFNLCRVYILLCLEKYPKHDDTGNVFGKTHEIRNTACPCDTFILKSAHNGNSIAAALDAGPLNHRSPFCFRSA